MRVRPRKKQPKAPELFFNRELSWLAFNHPMTGKPLDFRSQRSVLRLDVVQTTARVDGERADSADDGRNQDCARN